MKRTLVVGGAGYIGGVTTDVLGVRDDYSVTVLDNLLYESRFLKEVDFVFGDVRDKKLLAKILPNYDVVIWLAAIVGDQACIVDISYSKQVNVSTVRWLVDNYGGKIVFASTCSVYGANSALLDENSETSPLSLYASTKIEAEEYLLEHAKDPLIFRLGTLYGMGDVHTRLRFDLVANILTLKAIRGEPLCIFGGEQWRPLLHVRDVAYAIEYFLDKDLSGLYVLSAENVKIADLGAAISKMIPGTEVEYQTMKYEDLRDYKVDNAKALSTGWRPRVTLEDGIREIEKAVRENRIKNARDPVYSNIAFLENLRQQGVYGSQ